MTTLEPEQKDILEKLNKIALEENWGTVDRDPNGIPKGVAVVMEAMREIKRLRELPKEILKHIRNIALSHITDLTYPSKECIKLADFFTEIKVSLCKLYGVTLDEKNS